MSNQEDHHPAFEESESEWEYEYHPTETETFYVTLDLSSATQDTLSSIKREKSKATVGAKSAVTDGASTSDQPAHNGTAASAAEDENEPSKIQILDIHSENPLVSYDGHVYSCNWTRTIGTDLIFAGPDVELPIEPAHREASFQIAAFSSIRLMGKTAKLVPKETPAEAHGSRDDLDTADRVKISIPASAREERRKQAAFLERLANIKRARGDTDEVLIGRGKSYADYRPKAEPTPSPRKRMSSRRKGKQKMTVDWDPDEAEDSEDAIASSPPYSTAPKYVTRSHLPMHSEEQDLMDNVEDAGIPTLTTRTSLRNRKKQEKDPDVQMHDAE